MTKPTQPIIPPWYVTLTQAGMLLLVVWAIFVVFALI